VELGRLLALGLDEDQRAVARRADADVEELVRVERVGYFLVVKTPDQYVPYHL